ncbi:malate synthase A [Legionella micdadei]|uniref:Malate synthase n=1 Tax=Legionella micdadei TaxID=451 RepID=A0A098GEW6_LEGMI|nr:malate synthase A [Legionella micdadei]ARG97500.1 malate synthase A [Legionella micdadei]KTD28398.1 Malate synthase A [Legionella micdadei]NSL17025.1 malate synthase A [Legionella micdadei]CEG61009.1 Malate synthase [Legionella micdadei]SCY70389.1 malate synthase [Legionella micdadei]
MIIQDVTIIPKLNDNFARMLTPEALAFFKTLEVEFGPRRKELLKLRQEKQKQFDQGLYPNFLKETEHVRAGNWQAAEIPYDLLDRRVEITGPVDRKMIINALNSGAKVFMADFEDSNSPTWDNCIQGQLNLCDAVDKTIAFRNPENDKEYKLNPITATLMVRPRGWHLDEAHVLINNQPVSASIFDFSLFFYHNARKLIAQGSGPYFYLPKIESHLEARLWNDIFCRAQQLLNISRGTIRATVLIETISAAFEMDEILYELKEHSAGLNCGRWDYIFSFIKKFRNHSEFVLPDRQEVTMTTHFLQSYVHLLIATCHRRGVHAMGGMAAQIPIKGDEKANDEAMEKVLADKKREASAGHDGTWVAHPGLIPIALKAFEELMPDANQIHKHQPIPNVTQSDLLKVPEGKVTEQGIRNNISVGIQYLYSWLKGNGCVPINNLMEDAATAEICRSQLWQWLKFAVRLSDGRKFDKDLFDILAADELEKIKTKITKKGLTDPELGNAFKLFVGMITKDNFDEFLTLPAYPMLVNNQRKEYHEHEPARTN